MWKEIESYIENNRARLDIDRPSDKVWTQIEAQLDKDNPAGGGFRLPQILRVAAAIALAIGLSYIFAMYFPENGTRNLVSNIHAKQQITGIEQYDKMEAAYIERLEAKLKVLEEYRLDEYDFAPEYLQRIDKLKAEYQVLHQQAVSKGYSPELAQEIQYNFEKRLAVIDCLLYEIDHSVAQTACP